jgi:hypothetical protein
MKAVVLIWLRNPPVSIAVMARKSESSQLRWVSRSPIQDFPKKAAHVSNTSKSPAGISNASKHLLDFRNVSIHQ